MHNVKKLLIIAGVTLSLASCKTPTNITYLQDIYAGQSINVVPTSDITAQPGDRISIIVHSKDPLLVSQFNLPVATYRLGTSSQTGKSDAVSNSTSNNGNGQVSTYVVDSFGDIDFPVLGTLHVADMNRKQIQDLIRNDILSRDLVKDPTVIVEFLDHSVTILGDISSPGRVRFDRDRFNLIEAIGIAGDLKISGKRQNVKIIRMEEGKEKVYEVDLCDANSVYSSPAFYLRQNDVIYIEPNDKQKRSQTSTGETLLTPSFWMSVVSFAMTLYLFIDKL
jgi:polysaccharide export outer membrane protein